MPGCFLEWQLKYREALIFGWSTHYCSVNASQIVVSPWLISRILKEFILQVFVFWLLLWGFLLHSRSVSISMETETIDLEKVEVSEVIPGPRAGLRLR